MKLYFYDNYQEEGCTFCGDDGGRWGLVATVYCSVKLPQGTIESDRLKPLIKNLEFDEKEQLEFFLDRYPNAKIDIIK